MARGVTPCSSIDVRIGPIYRGGAIYLAKKIIRYDIFQNTCKCFILIHPISTYNFWGNHSKIPYFPFTTFFFNFFFSLGAQMLSIFLCCPVTNGLKAT